MATVPPPRIFNFWQAGRSKRAIVSGAYRIREDARPRYAMAIPPSRRFINHDRRLLSVLEVIASHFVDIYYNHIWSSAETGKKGEGLADEYVRLVKAYITGVKTDPSCYKAVAGHLHTYYSTVTRHTALPFANFADQVVAHLIPEEYLAVTTAAQKDETFEAVLVDLVSGLGAYVTGPALLTRVVDQHHQQPDVTIRMLQDQGVGLLLAKRAEIHNRFLRKLGQARELPPDAHQAETLKAALKKLLKEKVRLQRALGETEERAMELEDAVRAGKKREAKFRRYVRLLSDGQALGPAAAAHRAAAPRGSGLAEMPALRAAPLRGSGLAETPPARAPPRESGAPPTRAANPAPRAAASLAPPAESPGIDSFFADFDPLAAPLGGAAPRGAPPPRKRASGAPPSGSGDSSGSAG